MADKYIIHGAAYCGDGTASNEAASAGAAGAWNDINVLEGAAPAYGTAPAAGDVVYIRSKTSAGADITRTLTASVTLGSAAATGPLPVIWVLDGGSIWVGIDGTLTYNCPSTFVVAGRNCNRYLAENSDRLVVREANAAPNYKAYFGGLGVHLKNVLFDFSAGVSSNGSALTRFSGCSVLENVHIKSYRREDRLISVGEWSRLLVINPLIELLSSASTSGVFSCNAGNSLEVIGGAIVGAGATTGVSVLGAIAQAAVARFIGLQFPQTMTVSAYPANSETQVVVTGADGLVGARVISLWGEANSRTDAYYPTLNATLPDSMNTPWSWWIYPKLARPDQPMQQTYMKVYSEEAAAKNIDLEVLVSTTFSAIKGATLWMDVGYTDATTGLPKSLSTMRPTAPELDESSAGWSVTTYGATAYNKRRLRITTPTAIKQDSLITVSITCTAPSLSANDTLVVCPDFVLSTP